MLNVQPNFTTSAYKPVFRGEKDFLTEDAVNEEKDFYARQIDGFNEIIDDEYMPSGMKKAAKVLRIISEGILEGWAVAWGAKKGLNFLKSSSVKTINSNTYKKAAEILQPTRDYAAKILKNVKKYAVKKLGLLKKSKFAKSNFSQYVVKQYNKLKTVAEPYITKIKEKTTNITYEKATNATATVLGVGSGATGAINAAIRENTPEQEYYEAV